MLRSSTPTRPCRGTPRRTSWRRSTPSTTTTTGRSSARAAHWACASTTGCRRGSATSGAPASSNFSNGPGAASHRVAVWHVDRLFRQPRDPEKLIDLADRGFKVISSHGARDLSDPDDRSILRIEVRTPLGRPMTRHGASGGGFRTTGSEVGHQAARGSGSCEYSARRSWATCLWTVSARRFPRSESRPSGWPCGRRSTTCSPGTRRSGLRAARTPPNSGRRRATSGTASPSATRCPGPCLPVASNRKVGSLPGRR